MRPTTFRLAGVSTWKYNKVKKYFDVVYNSAMLGGPDGSLFNRAERCFLDLDIQLSQPTATEPLWRTCYDLHKTVDKLLMEELHKTYGAAKMGGISIDPVTHQLLHSPAHSCTNDEWREMAVLHREYNTLEVLVSSIPWRAPSGTPATSL